MSASERFDRFQENDGVASILSVLRRRWMIVVAVVLACLAVAVVRHQHAAKNYDATASVAFRNTTLPDAALQVTASGSGDPVRDAATEVLIARSQQVAAAVRQQLHTKAPPSALLDMVKVEAADNADVLRISASTGDPQFSARLANAFANQYIAFKANSEVANINSAQDELRQQINSLPAGSADKTSLQQSLQRLGELRAVAGGGANIIGLASPPGSPSGSGMASTLILGLLIGLAVAFSLVFLLESLDRRIKTVEEFEREYRLPAIVSVPRLTGRATRADERIDSLEPFRILRSALDLASVTRELNSLLITSAVPGEGKTTVAVDLAHAAALDGRHVVLVELDLRRPTFASHFGLQTGNGLTMALAGGMPASEFLIEPFDDLPNLSVLPAGPLPPNPSELLGSSSVNEMIAEFASDETLLIIDAPPLNPVADAQVLLHSPAINAPLIVARLGTTTRDDVRHARAILARQIVEPVGLVITGTSGGTAYGYEPYATPGESLNGAMGGRRKPSARRRLSI
jgi:capsular exopolysaccharide synthesis family protein